MVFLNNVGKENGDFEQDKFRKGTGQNPEDQDKRFVATNSRNFRVGFPADLAEILDFNENSYYISAVPMGLNFMLPFIQGLKPLAMLSVAPNGAGKQNDFVRSYGLERRILIFG